MARLLHLLHSSPFSSKFMFYDSPSNPSMLWRRKSSSFIRKHARFQFQFQYALQPSLQGSRGAVDDVEISLQCKVDVLNGEESDVMPHVQTLSKFPKEELAAKVVMVRFDSTILLREELNQRIHSVSVSNAVFTIKYLHEAGAKVILVGDWSKNFSLKLHDAESVADFLSSLLQHKVFPIKCISRNMTLKIEDLGKADVFLLENLSEFKEEVANCSNFSRLLSSMVDIFINDSFSKSHKILASTVGVARFCYACLAGFHFEQSLCQLKSATKTDKKPFVAIIGGGNISDKAVALKFLASRCDGLVFVGLMAFQIMHALGLSIPVNLVEHGAVREALDIIQFANFRNIPILYPKDFWCQSDRLPMQLKVFTANGILDGWSPVDLGPVSLDEISSLLTRCKKIIFIGPVKFKFSSKHTDGAAKLARMLDVLSQNRCDITLVGDSAYLAMKNESICISNYNMVQSTSVVWEFLKGRKLPGVMALDRAYPFKIDWSATYSDPDQPLAVDIGSGNGLFLLGMAGIRKDLNVLGLEINEKLVRCCLDSVRCSGIKNGYFIATNATSTFRSIISSYPGKLILVSIQCPNPDFNKPEHRWSMLQRSLVEAIVDLLTYDGKVFLQSDIEAVAIRMKEDFLKYGKGELTLMHDQHNSKFNEGGWLKENPFGIPSDWEQHVLDRGAPMYRLMFSKSTSI